MADSAGRQIGAGVIALAFAWPAWASAVTLNFRQAVDVALRQNPDLISVQSQIAQAKAGLAEANGARLPKITAGVGAMRTNDALTAFGFKLSQRQATFNDFGAGQFNPNDLNIAPDNLNYPSPVNNFNTHIEAQIPLYTGGKLQGYREQARSMLLAAQAGDQAARQQIIAHALQAYDGVYTARAFQDVAAKALNAAQTQLAAVNHLYEQGVVTKSDLLSAQVHLEDVKLQQQQAANQEAQAMDALHVVLGVPLAEKIDLGPEVEVTMPAGDPAGWIGESIRQNPKILAMQHQIEAANGNVEVARAALYPQVGAMARFDTNDPNLGFSAHSYTIGAQLTWTLFDGGVTRQGVDQAAAAREELQAKLQAAENQLGMQIQDSFRNAIDAERQVQTRELAVQQSEEAARIVNKRYAEGVGTLVEMQGAQAQLDKARADLVLARNQVNMQRTALRLALGRLTLDGLKDAAAPPVAAPAVSPSAPVLPSSATSAPQH